MAVSREIIFTALFDRLKASTGPLVNYFTRRLEGWDSTAPALEPAIALVKGGEHPDYPANGVGAVWKLAAHILVYVRDDGSIEGSIDPRFNNILDAIEAALELQPGEIAASNSRPHFPALAGPPAPTTLGGLVSYCRISGDVEVYQGVISSQGFVRIPLEMLVTA